MTSNQQSSAIIVFSKLTFLSIFIGGFIGGITNIINGYISPEYFRRVMNWKFQNVWTASIAQGIFEGLLYGLIFSFIFITFLGIITKGKSSFQFGYIHLQKVLIIILCCWAIGGIAISLLALLSADFFLSHNRISPEETLEMIKFAWVKGSINGGMYGGIISLIISLISVKNQWDKLPAQDK